MDRLAIIPARGGSKGIPHKNLSRVGGRTLIERAVHAVSNAGVTALVSTDSTTIAAAVDGAGGEVLMRPRELATDEAPSEAALRHALASLEQAPDAFAFVQCTSPFLIPDDVDRTLAAVEDGAADSAFTAVPFHGFLWRVTDDSSLGVNHDAAIRERRQDRPREYLETGAVYAMRTAGFLEHGHRFFGHIVPVEVSAQRALEVDEPDDLWLANAIAFDLAPDARELVPDDVKAVVFDFDGVLTDNGVYLDAKGTEAVRCDRSDGMGVDLLRSAGMEMMVLSKEKNPVVGARCDKLSLQCMQGVDDKQSVLRAWAADRALDLADIIFVGNDVNDVECLELAGLGVAVADAHPVARRTADVVLNRAGGHGAVRELADLVLTQLGAT